MKETVLHCDFETRSTVDLKSCGADVYSKHKDSRVMAFGFAFDEDEIEVRHMGEPPPYDVIDYVKSNGKKIVAHNASFEWLIWNNTWRKEFSFLPPLNHDQLICTMARAYAMALPGSLENAALAVGLDTQKDAKGKRIMLQLSQPKTMDEKTGAFTWHDETKYADKYQALYNYCKVDVEVERQLYKRLAKLSDTEQKVWLLDQKINNRGVSIDYKAAKAALHLVEMEKNRLDLEMRKITDNNVATCTATKQLTDWLIREGVEDVEGVTKNEVTSLLKDKKLSNKIIKALQLRQEAAKSSTAKIPAMINGMNAEDKRIRGLFQYHGASTGRWAGRRVQLHNLPRPKLEQDNIEKILDMLANVE